MNSIDEAKNRMNKNSAAIIFIMILSQQIVSKL